MIDPEQWLLPASAWVPNNPHLPVLAYRQAIDTRGHGAAALEALFDRNGWTGIWRNGIFSYQHFHAEAHEALGCARGRGTVLIGGPTGKSVEVAAGDVLVLPAGTGHCRREASDDFLIVGAYPPGQRADMCTGDQGSRIARVIEAVALPQTDPVYGADGPLVRLWQGDRP